MSWARFGADDSDVYLFPTTHPDDGHVAECCGCQLPEYKATHDSLWGHFHTADLAEFLAHLDKHRAAGHVVPDYVDGLVRAEWSEFIR